MVRAFISLQVEDSSDGEVLRKIRKVKGVTMAYLVTGATDIIAFIVYRGSVEALGSHIIQNIDTIPGITTRVTSVVLG